MGLYGCLLPYGQQIRLPYPRPLDANFGNSDLKQLAQSCLVSQLKELPEEMRNTAPLPSKVKDSGISPATCSYKANAAVIADTTCPQDWGL